MSAQYSSVIDENNLAVCLNLDYSAFANVFQEYVLDPFLGPILKKLPGRPDSWVLPLVSRWIALDGPAIVDDKLNKLPFGLGSLYNGLWKCLDDWTMYDWRNMIFNYDERADVLAPTGGMLDFALDARLARNKQVYHGSACKKNHLTDDYPELACPDALPVCEAYLVNTREGDKAMHSMQFQWPMRAMK